VEVEEVLGAGLDLAILDLDTMQHIVSGCLP